MSISRSSAFYRFSLLLVVSIAMMIIDYRSTLFHPLRLLGSGLNIAVESIIGLPKIATETLYRYYPDEQVHQELARLQQQQTILKTKLQRYEALEAEYRRLTTLLAVSQKFDQPVLLAELIRVGADPFSQKIIINRGVEAGVYVGQPALAPQGLIGQVSEVGYHRSVITQITDYSHALPVQVLRNGLHTIIHGSGRADRIHAPYLPSQADIRPGDLLITSGLGGRFPAGYKVAYITDIIDDANQAFLHITAETVAKIGFISEVLLVWGAPAESAQSVTPTSQ